MDSVDANQWEFLKIGNGPPKVYHIMFADDLILFGAETGRKINIVLHILHHLCQMSEQ